jgi:hypothetical protein
MAEQDTPLYTVETTGHLWWKVRKIAPALGRIAEQLDGLPPDDARLAAGTAGYEAGTAARTLNREGRRLDAARGALVGSFALGEQLGPGIETAYAVGVIRGVWGDGPPAELLS